VLSRPRPELRTQLPLSPPGRSLDACSLFHRFLEEGGRASLGKLSPDDLRRTCAKLCRKAGGDLEEIQFLLGHASIVTAERYLGTDQNLSSAVNDALGLELE
jgi:integrase